MKLAVLKEIHPGERRVAATPDTTKRLIKLGFQVLVEKDAGALASFPDCEYETAGATIVADTKALYQESDVVLRVRPPDTHPTLGDELELLREGQTLISFLWPAKNPAMLEVLAQRGVTALAMDQIPRITRAQKMDALSSMANIAGYRAVIEAASAFGRFFTGQMTAAGKVPPAKVLVIGAGVAGLAAIGAARSLGAIVRAFDTRPAVKEQVQSMGAEFLELSFKEDGTGEGGYAKVMSQEFIDAEMALFLKQAKDVDIIITTALIPGRPAPVLLKREAVEAMRPGSVVVDLAAEAGGNCELTAPNEVVQHKGVTIIGYADLPSRLAPTSSQLYGSNLCHLLSDMGGGEAYRVDIEDEVVRGALVAHKGKVMYPAPRREPAPQKAQTKADLTVTTTPAKKKGSPMSWALLIGTVVFAGIGISAPTEFVTHFSVFVLACFVGWQVVWNVTPALHTPLMSVTNAISGIILIGGMLQISGPPDAPITILAAVAVLIAMINVSGGFLVTQRMLKMFQR